MNFKKDTLYCQSCRCVCDEDTASVFSVNVCTLFLPRGTNQLSDSKSQWSRYALMQPNLA